MRGRTNVGGGGVGIYADTENFTVAEGSNVTAGNFVQYKLAGDDRKYDTNTGYGKQFAKSDNETPKVLPLGNSKFIRRYKNNGEQNTFWFNLIDVTEEFNVLSAISITSTKLPSFCLLNDGNIAICYMTAKNTITIRVYNVENSFLLFGTYNLSNENVGEIETTHITQLGNGKILTNKMNSCFVCDYSSGVVTERGYIDFGLKYLNYTPNIIGDNDWNLYAEGENKFLIFPKFVISGQEVSYQCYLIKNSDMNMEILDNITMLDASGIFSAEYYFDINGAIWGNAFSINGKILFSNGFEEQLGPTNVNASSDIFNTKIIFAKENSIMQAPEINLLDITINAFDTNYSIGTILSSTSCTAQYVKENVFYLSILPRTNSDFNKEMKTAICRIEYNPSNAMFETSNIVTFNQEDSTEYFSGFGQFFESENGDVYYLYETSANTRYKKSGRWLMKLSCKDGVLSIGESTGLVENYNGSGAAIGVAKQSGGAGQIVEVYVPKF